MTLLFNTLLAALKTAAACATRCLLTTMHLASFMTAVACAVAVSAHDDAPRALEDDSEICRAGVADDDDPILGTGMCNASFESSGMSKRPKKPGAMNGAVSTVPGITDDTNLKVGSASDNSVELLGPSMNMRPQRAP